LSHEPQQKWAAITTIVSKLHGKESFIMKRANYLSLLLGALVLCTTSWNAQAQLAYRLQHIDDPSSPSDVIPEGLNNKGEVIGTAYTTGTRGFRWKNGVYTDLQTATGSTATVMQPTGINDRSIIVGNQNVEPRNFMIRDGQLLPLQITGGVGEVIAINNRNQIVGRAQSSVFIWERGRTTYLPRLPDSDDYVTTAADINDRGVVAGTSGTVDEISAVIWKDGAVIALPLPEETSNSVARAINNFDQVVGNATGQPGVTKAFLWESGTMRELPPPAGATASIVWSINDWGAVVGESTMSQGGAGHATLWVSGQAHDLNDLLDANEPLRDQILLLRGFFINERGQIVADGVDRTNGTRAVYLLTPTYRAPALP
jgi:probable HAF family extracellular repeat protein